MKSARHVIDKATITLDELGDPETSECALASFTEPLHHAIVGNCAEVNIPLRFIAKRPDPPNDAAAPASP